MAPVARMPLADEALAVLGSALRDPQVVLRYQAKIATVPGSNCLWWSGASLRATSRTLLRRHPG